MTRASQRKTMRRAHEAPRHLRILNSSKHFSAHEGWRPICRAWGDEKKRLSHHFLVKKYRLRLDALFETGPRTRRSGCWVRSDFVQLGLMQKKREKECRLVDNNRCTCKSGLFAAPASGISDRRGTVSECRHASVAITTSCATPDAHRRDGLSRLCRCGSRGSDNSQFQTTIELIRLKLPSVAISQHVCSFVIKQTLSTFDLLRFFCCYTSLDSHGTEFA